jgi:hypothetical protein
MSRVAGNLLTKQLETFIEGEKWKNGNMETMEMNIHYSQGGFKNG